MCDAVFPEVLEKFRREWREKLVTVVGGGEEISGRVGTFEINNNLNVFVIITDCQFRPQSGGSWRPTDRRTYSGTIADVVWRDFSGTSRFAVGEYQLKVR